MLRHASTVGAWMGGGGSKCAQSVWFCREIWNLVLASPMKRPIQGRLLGYLFILNWSTSISNNTVHAQHYCPEGVSGTSVFFIPRQNTSRAVDKVCTVPHFLAMHVMLRFGYTRLYLICAVSLVWSSSLVQILLTLFCTHDHIHTSIGISKGQANRSALQTNFEGVVFDFLQYLAVEWLSFCKLCAQCMLLSPPPQRNHGFGSQIHLDPRNLNRHRRLVIGSGVQQLGTTAQ